VGAISEFADAMGGIIYVGSILDATGLPELELWSYTKSASGILGRTPFRLQVTYFELLHQETIDLLSNRVVTVTLTDNVAPSVVVANPIPGFGTQESTIDVDGTAYDSQSGFAFDINNPQLPGQYVELSTDNVTWVQAHVKTSSAFEIQFGYTFVGLSESVRAIYVRIHDDSNNYVLKVIPVRVDRTAPIVTILSPLTTSVITNALTIRLSAETEVGTLVLVNGLSPPEIFTRPDGVHVYFVMDIPVFEGPQTITVVAVDSLNNQGNASIFVLVDRQAPYLAVLSPVADALVKESDVTVVGLTEASGVTLTINGQAVAVNPVTGSFSGSVHLSTDINRVQIEAMDAAGNVQLVVRDVRLDTTVPWINVQSPASNALLNSPEVDVVGIVEPGSQLIVNDEVVNAPTGAFQRRILLTEGPNTIVFIAVDAAGNSWERDLFVTVDTQRPTLEITSPANETLWNRTTLLMTGTVSDEHTPMIRVNGQDVAVNTDGTFQVGVSLFEGTNFVKIEAMDGAKNVNTKVWTIIRDTEKPFLVSTLEDAFFEGVALKTYNTTVTVTGYTERGSVLEVCFLNPLKRQVCNAIPLSADGGYRTFVDLRLKETNEITVTSTDAAGNSITRTLQVIQGDRPPAPPETISPTVLGLFGLGGAILVGSFFLLYMRRGKGGRGAQLAELESVDGQATLGEANLEVAGTPELAVESNLETPPAVALTPAPGPAEGAEDVPAAPTRARPMRRRPVSPSGGDEAGTLTGMGAEDEAKPGDTHQSGEDENKGA
jgi:hypothetical protein